MSISLEDAFESMRDDDQRAVEESAAYEQRYADQLAARPEEDR